MIMTIACQLCLSTQLLGHSAYVGHSVDCCGVVAVSQVAPEEDPGAGRAVVGVVQKSDKYGDKSI